MLRERLAGRFGGPAPNAELGEVFVYQIVGRRHSYLLGRLLVTLIYSSVAVSLLLLAHLRFRADKGAESGGGGLPCAGASMRRRLCIRTASHLLANCGSRSVGSTGGRTAHAASSECRAPHGLSVCIFFNDTQLILNNKRSVSEQHANRQRDACRCNYTQPHDCHVGQLGFELAAGMHHPHTYAGRVA